MAHREPGGEGEERRLSHPRNKERKAEAAAARRRTHRVDRGARGREGTSFGGGPYSPNRRTGRRYGHKTLQALWNAALERVGFPHVPLYEGTKHSFATDAIRRGVSEYLLQKFLGHAHPESTRRYARLADAALVQVLPKRSWRQAGDKGPRDKPERMQRDDGGPSWTRTRDQTVMSRPL